MRGSSSTIRMWALIGSKDRLELDVDEGRVESIFGPGEAGRAVGACVGLGVPFAFATTMVGPAIRGSLPTSASASKVTCQVPSGRRAVPRYVPPIGRPEV